MSLIFISYAAEDRERAGRLARALEAHHLDVFWDRKIRTGQDYHEVISEKLDLAQCIVVLWSKASIKSTWVRDEAETGKQRGILLPVFIDQGISPPLGFRGLQTADLSGWDGSETNDSFRNLVSEITETLGPVAARETAQTLRNEIFLAPLPQAIKDELLASQEQGTPKQHPTIFLSYAMDDYPIARTITYALEEIGWKVHAEKHREVTVDWDIRIRQAIERCTMFVPIISKATQNRAQGYFRREWSEAARVALTVDESVPFLFPIIVDGLELRELLVPEIFTRVRMYSLPEGEVTSEFKAHMQELLRDSYKRSAARR